MAYDKIAHTGTCLLANTGQAPVRHRVAERRYPAIDYQQHAGDTACGLVVDNGGRWSWCSDHGRDCFFCWPPEDVR